MAAAKRKKAAPAAGSPATVRRVAVASTPVVSVVAEGVDEAGLREALDGVEVYGSIARVRAVLRGTGPTAAELEGELRKRGAVAATATVESVEEARRPRLERAALGSPRERMRRYLEARGAGESTSAEVWRIMDAEGL